MSTKLFVLYGCIEYLILTTKRQEVEKCQSVESFDFTITFVCLNSILIFSKLGQKRHDVTIEFQSAMIAQW